MALALTLLFCGLVQTDITEVCTVAGSQIVLYKYTTHAPTLSCYIVSCYIDFKTLFIVICMPLIRLFVSEFYIDGLFGRNRKKQALLKCGYSVIEEGKATETLRGIIIIE